ncbi:hypothetical protein [Flavobacterium succinicans]|uniref:hypothetical protein n=1 Tax=Flavobacterium succinicans TaxID=29536 RepID=UPI000A5D4A1D|nr:hypothetical protein [Flavobacterium succinicans]
MKSVVEFVWTTDFFFSPDRNGNPGVPKTSGSCAGRATNGSSCKRSRTTVFWNEEL